MAQSAQIAKIGWWHERLADWMIANPELQLKDAAAEFNCTQSWISIIKNSDAFKIYWEIRSTAVSDQVETRTASTIVGIKEKTAALTELALDRLAERVEKNGVVMPVEQLLDVASTGLKALGYSSNKSTPAPAVNVNIGLVDQATLQKARERAFTNFGIKAESPAAPAGAPIEVTDFEVVE